MVQRYNPDYVMHAARFAPFARESEHGEFVKFSDYEALLSELASSRQINAQTLLVKLTMAETIKEQTDRVNALAVENAALKSRSIKLFNLGYLHGHESTVEGHFVDVHRSDIDTYHDDVVAEIIEDEGATPATDAALAAIRLEAKIEGVNELAERIAEMHSKTAPGSNIEKKLMFAAEAAIAYANGLREAK
ncbi:hypothetical protein ATE40_007355 [Serratia surfactantfaciens]|uniref:hypothetical protein n=1 Tax=Serratia surfactantfaciens TaxID=2741499 RepID=UPI0007C7C90B|nr:hypothetical protein [Serratia surfactantfaciens]AOE99074.1 hypothetical protein ATE40_007355 [Serratia surfactantfaciens]